MAKSWEQFEGRVRKLASFIWGKPAAPERVGGVAIDCVLRLSDASIVLIEITEQVELNKVRDDIVKLDTARAVLFATEKIYAQCFCVVNSPKITPAMFDAGKDLKIQVASATKFEQKFFDFEQYREARQKFQFGSAVNPLTGEVDTSAYTPVTYLKDENQITVEDISDLLLANRRIVLTGEYGSGKSRCLREVFFDLAAKSAETGKYPIAIDLRESWGLKRAPEIITRHFSDLGFEPLASRVLRSIKSDNFIFLLDGFYELGFQAWSDDEAKLKNLRQNSLEGVRDLVRKTNAAVLVCGREHYFNNNDDMIKSLSFDQTAPIHIRSKTEFSEAELGKYMASIADDYVIPSWIPRRPLICQVIVSLSSNELDRMFGESGNDVEFWHQFFRLLCERDAKINASFDADAIAGVLTQLARITRSKSNNVGPITLGEIQHAFESVVGELPGEQASVMLQRLPGLGRVRAESNDRQFIDVFILDGLRALDVDSVIKRGDSTVEDSAWQNPLQQLGQRILAHKINVDGTQKAYMQVANRCASKKNRVVASDIASSLVRTHEGERDFGGLAIDDGRFAEFDMTIATPINLRISNSYFSTLTICPSVPRGTVLTNCIAQNVIGVSAAKGIPQWAEVEADTFQSVQNVATIRKLGLKPAQEVLVTIIRKTFFQKGSGRKEEALLRGLGRVVTPNTARRILNTLVSEGLLTEHPGDEGSIYNPNRAQAARMQKMIDELNTSQDPIWVRVSSF